MSNYICIPCNFNSSRKYDYTRHIKTKKHINQLTLFNTHPKNQEKYQQNDFLHLDVKKIPPKKCICKYCGTKISHISNKLRHYKVCKAKKEQETKDKLIETLRKENEIIAEENKKKTEELLELEKDFVKFMKKHINTINSTNNGTINNINDNRQYNMYYVINNYKEAHNIEDLLTSPLTDEEKQYIIDNGSTLGCYIQYKYCI